MATSNSINFVVNALDCSVSMDLCGTLFKYPNIPTIDADATAVFYVSLEDMKKVFTYQTDAVDVIDANSSDLKYMVNIDFFPWDLNPANACLADPYARNPVSTVSSRGEVYAPNKMFVVHDFIRYLASKLFGTPFASDLFYNEIEMLHNIRYVCGNSAPGCVWYDLYHKVQNISKTGNDVRLVQGISGEKFLTNDTPDEINICRAIFQTIMTIDPQRFSHIEDTDLFQAMPFIEYDTISMKLILHPADAQHTLTSVNQIYSRSYEIKLILVNNPVNPAVDPAEL